MSPVLALALQALQHDMSALDRVAHHLSHAHATGWRRAVATVEAAASDAPAPGARLAGHLVLLDERPGALRATGQPLDLALSGAGWFEIQGPEGVVHTRRGDFRLDGQGRLVTQQGHPVLGTAGEIRLAASNIAVDPQGRVYDADQPGRQPAQALAQLRIVRFEPGTPAVRGTDGLLQFAAAPSELPEPQVRQGWLEGSNVVPAHEMLQLMQLLRHAQAVQKVAGAWDDVLGAAIRRLGDPT